MTFQISLSTAIIIASVVAALAILLVVIVGQMLKPDPQPRLYCSVEENIEKKAAEAKHE